MPQRLRCPHEGCTCVMNVPDERRGSRVRCPKCKRAVEVPTEGADTKSEAVAKATPGGVVGPPDGLPSAIGRFQVRAFLGRGAFGAVYRAYDPRLDREVALKVPLPGALDGPGKRERFLREARAAARLRHPNIVPLFETGAEPDLYLASAFVEGRTLDTLVAEGPVDFRTAAAIVRDLAGALAYAHAEGVVHRDVKPANVIVDGRGAPHLLDFGLAGGREGDERLTQDGALLGTPAYMAPELVTSPEGGARPTADQYALGCLLYELLTGRTPFQGPPEVVLFNAVNAEVPPLRQFRPDVPKDLETIALKCLSREPVRRYAGCLELANDLRRWQEGEPILARPIGTVGRLARWVSREPLTAALVGAVAFLLIGGLAVAWGLAGWALAETERANEEAGLKLQEAQAAHAAESRANESARLAKRREEEARELARKAKEAEGRALDRLERIELVQYGGQLVRAHSEWQNNNVARALETLESCRWDLRNWEHRYLWTLTHDNHFKLRGHSGAIASVACSPNGGLIASGGWDGAVKIWDVEKGLELFHLWSERRSVVNSLAFSPDGQKLAAGGGWYDGGTNKWLPELQVWDAPTGKKAFTLVGHSYPVTSVAFSPNGQLLLSGAKDGTVRGWDPRNGKPLFQRQCHAGGHTNVTFSPDGRRVVTGSGDKTLKVWDTANWRELLALRGHTAPVTSLAYSPDGKRIASRDMDGMLRVWDSQSGKGKTVLTPRGNQCPFTSVAYSPDGKLLASAGTNDLVRVWDPDTGEDLLTLPGHENQTTLCFTPDGGRIVTAGGGAFHRNSVRVWSVQRKPESHLLRGHTGRVNSVAYSPDGKCIVSGGKDGALRIWNPVHAKMSVALKGHAAEVTTVTYSPDGARIASGSEDGTVTVWDPLRAKEMLALKLDAGMVTSVAYSPDGTRIACGGGVIAPGARPTGFGELKIWDARTGKEEVTQKGNMGLISSVAYRPGGNHIAAGDAAGSVKVCDARSGKPVLSMKGHAGIVHAITYSPDGKQILSAGMDKLAKLWDAETGEELSTLKGHAGWVTQGERITTRLNSCQVLDFVKGGGLGFAAER